MYKEIDGWRKTQMDMCLKSAKKQGNGNIEDYQHSELMVAMSHCSRIRVAVDIGAHVGLTAFQMAKSFDHVHAFEINPPIYECMVHNLKDRCNNVTTYPVGIGEIEENVDLVTTNKSFSTHIKPGTQNQNKGKLPVMPLDFYNLQDVDFIKIDAEGYEPLVALGAIETIKRCQPTILYERKEHPARYGYNRDSIRDVLMPYGYRMVRKIGRGEKNAVLAYRPGMAPDA